ncbi:MAG: rRNA maturation RNase YbeY [Psychromonas sp.]
MQLFVDLQIATDNEDAIPEQQDMQTWISKALVAGLEIKREEAELTVRIVDQDESQALNKQYRNMDKPTNVLSFPFQNPPGITLPLLGDLVICKNVVENEAAQQNKTLDEHWAHMLIHGTLHLIGYDHIDEQEALEMEGLETKLLIELGYADPYLSEKE